MCRGVVIVCRGRRYERLVVVAHDRRIEHVVFRERGRIDRFGELNLLAPHACEVGDFELSLAGEASKAPGSINVTKKASFGNIWLGRVTQDGVFQPSTKLEPYKKDSLASVLCALAANPAEVASAYGETVGKCCFCKKTLTDPKSTTVGYGPDCASHFKLPWGAMSKLAA